MLGGAGGFGCVASETEALKYDYAFADDGVEVGTEICGVKVVGITSHLTILFDEYRKLIVTIGNNVIRERIYKTAGEIGYLFPNHVTVQNGVSELEVT